MIELLGLGERYRKALGVVVARAGAMGKKGPKGLLIPLRTAKLRAPIAHPNKITCIGLNYADHAREGGQEPPPAPIFFLKSHNTICGPGDPIKLPPNSTQVDYEAEFAVVIGKRGSRIAESEAHKYIAGYTLLHDVSARDMQFSDKQWYRGKSCDTFAPTGPWIVTPDEIPDPQQPANLPDAQWRNPAGFQHQQPDLQGSLPDQLSLPIRHLGSGRFDFHRHASRRGICSQAPGVPESRRHGERDAWRESEPSPIPSSAP